MKRLSSQILAFTVVGLVNNLVNYMSFLILTFLGLHIFTSSSLGFMAGALVSYILNTRFTFSYVADRKSLARFFFAQLAVLLLFSIGSTAIYHSLVRSYSAAWLLSTILATSANFTIQKYIVFRSKSI